MSEWVEEGMRLAHDFRCAVPGDVFNADQKLRAHFAAREAEFVKTHALLEQMAEALNECLNGWEDENKQRGFEKWPEVIQARAAMAAYKEGKK